MKASFLKSILTILALVAFVVPVFVLADASTTTTSTANPHATPDTYGGLVRCTGSPLTDSNGNPIDGEVPCDFNALIGTFAYLINWGFGISLPIAVALFVWAGLLHVTGIPKNIDRARGIFKTTAGGFAIMLLAFTVVHTLVNWIGNSSSTSTTTNSNPLPVTTEESLLQVKQ